MATRLFERSIVADDGTRRFSAKCWVVEKDTERADTVEIIRCSSPEDAERELGDEVPENATWLLKRVRRSDRWRL